MKQALVILMTVCMLASCHTFMSVTPDYKDLPVDDLKQVADDIEKAVHDKNRDAAVANRGTVVVETDLIKQAIRTRATSRTLAILAAVCALLPLKKC